MVTSNKAKVMASFRRPGQTLKDLKVEWDELTDSDKADLLIWYEAEQALQG